MSLLNEELSTTKDCWKLALISASSHFLCDIYVENVKFFLGCASLGREASYFFDNLVNDS